MKQLFNHFLFVKIDKSNLRVKARVFYLYIHSGTLVLYSVFYGLTGKIKGRIKGKNTDKSRSNTVTSTGQ